MLLTDALAAKRDIASAGIILAIYSALGRGCGKNEITKRFCEIIKKRCEILKRNSSKF